MRSLALVAWIFAACSGSTPVTVDALPLCTMALYDPCNSEHDCTSDNCRPVGTNLQVCTVACTDNSPCVGSAGGPTGICSTTTGFCTPTAANACRIQ